MNTLLVLVDGMRPDGLQQAQTPAIDALMATGAWALDATTVMPSITLPCIVSLFQGIPPQEHGVTTNLFSPASVQVSLFEIVAQAGLKAASFYNWEQLRDLSQPGALHTGIYLNNSHDPAGDGDTALTRLAIDRLREDPVDFAFLYLGHTDVAGHEHGWMSAPYIEAIANADRCIQAIDRALPDWSLIVTADHGGHGAGHGTDSAEDMTIPIVLRPNHGAAGQGRLAGPASILDIAPTVAAWLDLETPSHWHGRPLG
jgi:predicted AlkP superfamily pyrophosphatase or phosphodiesterase